MQHSKKTMETYDYLIVGAGFAGAVAAERLAGMGKSILLVEKRGHLGGNCYDCYDEAGILIHRYGPHIFHTNSKEVWDYLSRFTSWLPYEHRVLANYHGQILTLPVNLNTLYELYDQKTASALEEKLISYFGRGQKISILELRQNNDPDFKDLAEVVYEKIYLTYTKKQWGVPPEELDPQVTERVPIWLDRDNRYFKDKYQGMPKEGYTKIFERLLDHSAIKVVLNKDYKELLGKVDYQKMIYTGPIDYYFDYKFGALPYRSLKFEFETLGIENFQEVAVVNYTGQEPFTRITEFKHLTDQKIPKTTILREYPEEYLPGKNIPCYPIPKKENFKLYERYKGETDKLENVIFIGRLAEYRYYNMDEVVGRALRGIHHLTS